MNTTLHRQTGRDEENAFPGESRDRAASASRPAHRGTDLVIDTLDEFATSWAAACCACTAEYANDPV